MAKKVTKAAPVKKAVKKVVEVKEEGFLLLIVFKVTHGMFFSNHSHYTTHLMKCKDDNEALVYTKAAKGAAKTMSNDIGIKTEVIISERIESTDKAQMREAVLAKISGV